MIRKPFISARTFSETSPLNPSSGPIQNVTRTSSYGSFFPYLEFLRNTLTRNQSSNQVMSYIELIIISDTLYESRNNNEYKIYKLCIRDVVIYFL